MPDELTEFEQQLREAAATHDPLPPHLLDWAEAAFGWRTIDAELAELAFDSLLQNRALVRGDQPRVLTFRTDTLSIELELTGDRLVGMLVPAGEAELTLQRGAGPAVPIRTDRHGRFTATAPGSGPLRLYCNPAGAPHPVVTDWFTP